MKTCEALSSSACCESYDRRKSLVVREKKRPGEYRVENPTAKTLLHIPVDSCLLAFAEGKKCDHLVAVCEEEQLFFVELKGSDVGQAARQLMATLTHPSIAPYVRQARSCFARIVPSKAPTPNHRPSDFDKLDKYIRRLNGNLRCESQHMTETV